MVRYFRLLGFVEAASLLLLLFVAMPMKYIGGMPQAVTAAGTLHGALFVLYFALGAVLASELRWSFGKLILACVIASVPFGPFVFDKKLFPERAAG